MNIDNCLSCRQEFLVTDLRKVFCSKKCGSREWEKQGLNKDAICVVCSKEFIAQRRSARCCSTACKKIKDAKGKRDLATQKTCEVCSVKFYSDSKKARYCSRQCAGKAKAFPLVNCNACGQAFKRKGGSKYYCSIKCLRVGESKTKIVFDCHHCGKSKTLPQSQMVDKKGFKRRFCSRKCFLENTAKIEIPYTCLYCNKVFLWTQTQKRTFCSGACMGYYRVENTPKQRTKIELAIANLLAEMKVDYFAQFRAGIYICDFYIPSANLVIECDGDYWHRLPKTIARDKRKNEWLIEHRYRVLRLPEWKIKQHIDQCRNEIEAILSEVVNQNDVRESCF